MKEISKREFLDKYLKDKKEKERKNRTEYEDYRYKVMTKIKKRRGEI